MRLLNLLSSSSFLAGWIMDVEEGAMLMQEFLNGVTDLCFLIDELYSY